MFSRKPQVVDIPEEMTDIWTCSSEGCNCWMRNNFTLRDEPECAVCGAPMDRGARMLPQVTNYTTDNHFARKG